MSDSRHETYPPCKECKHYDKKHEDTWGSTKYSGCLAKEGMKVRADYRCACQDRNPQTPETTPELTKLQEELTKRGYTWYDESDDPARFGDLRIERIRIEPEYLNFTVVHGFGTYGGWGTIRPDAGLLEVRLGSQDEPEGNLTAEQAIKKIDAGADLCCFTPGGKKE